MTDMIRETGAAEPRFDLCIVGAGASGLNALFAATRHLPAGARIALVDKRAAPGGMWNDVYDFVRLHQAHPMFTVGNIPWRGNAPPHYLARGDEVLGHLGHCLSVIERSADVTRLFGHSFVEAEEDGAGVTVHLDGPGGPKTLRADRAILSSGYEVEALDPLPLSSGAVRSTAPTRLSAEDSDPQAPVYVIGGGKTGMDTCHMLIGRHPGRRVVLLNGNGVAFGVREITTPRGLARWWRGTPIAKIFKEISLAYDGTNAREVIDGPAGRYVHSLDGQARNFLFGILSREEMTTIRNGLSEVIQDHLVDVIDGADGPEMKLRSGASRGIEPGALVVNCTGHLLRGALPPAPDYLSEGGRILRITPRSAVHFLSTVSAYFLTHLWYYGKLPHPDIHACDFAAVFQHDRELARVLGVVVSFQTQCALVPSLPFKVFDECGLDLNRWYPLPRRVPILIDLKRNGPAYVAHCQTVLDRVAAQTGLRIGPLMPRPVPA
ncbi:FAD-dependent oxidoreductase [Jannaschia seohaensis]|uniref:Pyridine nucleotide-disulfide oxidoreductase n=1 Tax=Jannaschia seohaensis TaxID=475081 RepID=A0A2Y9B6D5_9RHOB|nr:FAD-dependent oxidoreductase [Jannaschia seohaensis]PWJ13261.1 pyridine nucleotide-disulfide oxidoreductase [Jannaschia seohaensis]SSA50587.1 Pyridine nucleotide-disulphide oxidoreductase [Jannaschia seohaensis]